MIAQLGHWLHVGEQVVFVLAAVRLLFGVYRFARLPRAAKRNYPAAVWARLRWRWLTRNLNLAYLDQHRRVSKRPSVPFGTSVRVKAPVPGGPARLRFPRARFSADEFGIIARVRTVPGVGHEEFDQAADYISDAWRCVRVQVTQERPGRVTVRGLKRDPLTEPLSHDGVWPERFIPRLELGLDEWGRWRSLALGRNTTGVTVAGLPGTAKTSVVLRWFGDLSGTASVEHVVLDGKGGSDFSDWQDRCLVLTGDELPDALDALEFAHQRMRNRLSTVYERTGYRNAWAAGHPSPELPLLMVTVDEAANFYDVAHFKGDRRAEEQSRRCAGLTSQLIRRGGAVCVLVVLVTQKITGDAVPTQLRDNAALALAFGLKTVEASVAALGESIRKWPGHDPTTLQDSSFVGVCTASLRSGMNPYTRLRVPLLTESAAAERAAATAVMCREPAAEVPADEVPALTLV